MKKSYEIDMCNGPLLGKILLFSIPLMLSGILQLLFNAADIIVVGRFSGSTALAAVGSTSSLINLLINIFVGLSVGVNVLVARYYGGQKERDVQETIHTAVLTAILSGLFLVAVGELAAGPMLRIMGTPEDVLDQSVLYMRIYFLGMPVLMLYSRRYQAASLFPLCRRSGQCGFESVLCNRPWNGSGRSSLGYCDF